MSSMLSPDAMRARFHELKAEVEAIFVESAPLRDARDAFVQESRAQEDVMNAEIAAAEAGLFEKRQEMGMIARALNGQTGVV